jgi:uncharacterized protein (TIGR00375 family)
MSVEEIARFAKIKGLGLIGTGDFTHPKWLSELEELLAPEVDANLYKFTKDFEASVFFMITTEVNTAFTFENEAKRIHHVILTPNLETATQINDRLSRFGDLAIDGRPTLKMSASHLVEEVMGVSNKNMVFPAHIWTPWYSIFGAFSGFNSIEECYQDMTKHVHALETGLSSDPQMNWRLSKLDKFTLVSNSDCHSPWPWRIGREANVFELERPSYFEIINAIRMKDTKALKFTIETDPAYGKYHWTGHRTCQVSFSPQEAVKLGNICPVCRRRLTKGVEQRVEELADRPSGFEPQEAVSFVRLLPLSEIIAIVLGFDSPSIQKVWRFYNLLVERFGNEYEVLIDTPRNALSVVAGDEIAEAIISVRQGKAEVLPGYDGVYGQPLLSPGHLVKKSRKRRVQQLRIVDFVP